MSNTPKPQSSFFKYEELIFILGFIILAGVTIIPHWLDPSFNIFSWINALMNNMPLPSFHPHPPNLSPQLLHIIATYLRLILLLLICLGLYLSWRFIWRQQQRKQMKTYRIMLSRDDLATPLMVGALFDTIAKTLSKRYLRLLYGNSSMNFAFYRKPDGELLIIVRASERYIKNITSSLQDTWTSVRIEEFKEAFIFPEQPIVAVIRPRKRTDLFAFRSYRDYTHSVAEGILQQMDGFTEPAVFDITLKPLPERYSDKVTIIQRRHQRYLNALTYADSADPTLSIGDQAQLQGVVKQAGRSWWRVDIRVIASNINDLQSIHGALAASDAENQWQYHRVWIRKKWIMSLIQSGMPGFMPLSLRFFLNGTFLSTIWQLPTARLRVKGLTRASIRRGPGTVGLARNDTGCMPVQDDHGPIIVPEGDRKQGIITVGQQGTGKTTILQQVAVNDFRQDKATILIDPKFRMANDLRGLIPEGKKVAIWQVGNMDIPWGWNPFMQTQIDHDLIVAGVLDGMKQVWGKDGIGPRSTDYLRYSMAATLATGQASRGFLSVEEILREPQLWDAIGERLPSPLNSWFRTMAAKYEDNARLIVESTDAPLNKLSALTFADKMRHSLSTDTSLDIRRVIRDKGILIVSLEADRIGNESANLIGTFLVAAIWEALKREGVLNPATTSLIIDEAHRMVCPAFANMLAEGRSYGNQASVGLQFLDQIPDPIVKDSIDELLQNIFLFRSNQVEETEKYMKLFSRVYTNMIGPDAEIQDKLAFGPDDRFNLPNFHSLCRIVVDGNPKQAFLGTTIPLTPDPYVAARHPWGECPEEWLIRANPLGNSKPIEITNNELVAENSSEDDQFSDVQAMEDYTTETDLPSSNFEENDQVTTVPEESKTAATIQGPSLNQDTNLLAFLGVMDEQINYLNKTFGETVVNLAIKKTQKKASREALGDAYSYLTKVCQDIKRKETKGET